MDCACSLGPAELRDRLAEFADVFATLRRSDAPASNRRVWVLAWSPELEARVRALAEAEVACCSFFDFTVERDGAELRWTASTPATGVEMLATLDGIAARALAAAP